MSETRDARLVRKVIAIIASLDKHEIEPATDAAWIAFRDDPHRQFLKFSTESRERVWAAIQARLPADLREVAST